jgi:hypothetical protein
MPSLVSLSQINSPSGRGAGALATMLTKSAFLRYLDAQGAFELGGSTFNHKAIIAGSSLKTRAAGSAFSQTALTPASNQTTSQKIMGDSVKIDATYLRDAQKGLINIDAWLKGELAERLSGFGKEVEVALFAGAGSGSTFKGLAAILDGSTDVPGFTSHKGVVDANDYDSGDYFDLSTITTSQCAKFKEMLNIVISTVDNPTAICVNRSMYGRLNTIADLLKVGGTSLDEFGNRVKMYDGITILPLADGAIPNDEDDDNGTPVGQTTSIYVMGAAEAQCSIVTNSGLFYQDYDAPNASQQNEEWYEMSGAWKIQMKDSIRRIRFIKL